MSSTNSVNNADALSLFRKGCQFYQNGDIINAEISFGRAVQVVLAAGKLNIFLAKLLYWWALCSTAQKQPVKAGWLFARSVEVRNTIGSGTPAIRLQQELHLFCSQHVGEQTAGDIRSANRQSATKRSNLL